MDFYNEIKNLNDEELEKLVSKKIKKLEAEKPKDEPTSIGFNVESNPTLQDIFETDGIRCFELGMNCFHPGYIKKGTRIVYGLAYDSDGSAKNDGAYYYMDDEEYLYLFCKFIRDKDVTNEYELFEYILEFLRKYFGVIEEIPRNEMFKLLYKDNKTHFKPLHEHSIKDFKRKGNAMCTEYSATAQNIMSLFGIESYLIIGNEKIEGQKGGCHAFNIISFNEKESGEETNALIDYSAPVNIYNYNFDILGVSPYIVYLNEFNEGFVADFLYNNRRVTSEDYGYYIIGDKMLSVAYERDRTYYIDSVVCSDEVELKKI